MYGSEQSYYGTQQGIPDSRTSKSFIDNKPMIQGLVRSILKVEKGGEAHLINTGLTDVDGAKQIAANLFDFYDKDKSGSIDLVKVTHTTFRQTQSSPMHIVFSTQISILRNKMSIHSLRHWMSIRTAEFLSEISKVCVSDTSLALLSEFHISSMRVKMSTKDIDSKCHILSILILN
jgi:hypothetical protein